MKKYIFYLHKYLFIFYEIIDNKITNNLLNLINNYLIFI